MAGAEVPLQACVQPPGTLCAGRPTTEVALHRPSKGGGELPTGTFAGAVLLLQASHNCVQMRLQTSGQQAAFAAVTGR